MTPILANIVFDFFTRGGPLMWPILFCLFAALVVVAERGLWWWQLTRRTSRDGLNETFNAIGAGRFAEAAERSAAPQDPFLATVHEGLTTPIHLCWEQCNCEPRRKSSMRKSGC